MVGTETEKVSDWPGSDQQYMDTIAAYNEKCKLEIAQQAGGVLAEQQESAMARQLGTDIEDQRELQMARQAEMILENICFTSKSSLRRVEFWFLAVEWRALMSEDWQKHHGLVVGQLPLDWLQDMRSKAPAEGFRLLLYDRVPENVGMRYLDSFKQRLNSHIE